LSSEEYEAWAKAELENIDSKINKRGLKIAQNIMGCYYWIFQDQTDINFTPFNNCPKCGCKMKVKKQDHFNQNFCDDCRIVSAGD
jgi:predicted  nucleic acid-binding Zn ribbon protein